VRRLLRRGDARAAKAELWRLAGDLHAWQRRIADLDAALDRLRGHRETDTVNRAGAVKAIPSASERRSLHRAVEAAELDPPNHILTALGPRPDGPADRQVWRRAVRATALYRATWGVTDPASALGYVPADHAQRRAYAAALAALRTAQRQLGVDNPHEVLWTSSRSANDLSVGIG